MKIHLYKLLISKTHREGKKTDCLFQKLTAFFKKLTAFFQKLTVFF